MACNEKGQHQTRFKVQIFFLICLSLELNVQWPGWLNALSLRKRMVCHPNGNDLLQICEKKWDALRRGVIRCGEAHDSRTGPSHQPLHMRSSIHPRPSSLHVSFHRDVKEYTKAHSNVSTCIRSRVERSQICRGWQNVTPFWPKWRSYLSNSDTLS